MSRTFTSESVVAYSQCPRKAFFLLRGEPSHQHEYEKVLEDAHRPIVQTISRDFPATSWSPMSSTRATSLRHAMHWSEMAPDTSHI